jgi:ribosome production factor 2
MPGRPKGARAQRAMKRREPQLVEGKRRTLALRGPNTSIVSGYALADLIKILKPDVKGLSRANPILPFEEASSLEFLCEKNECSAFLYASHNKKRPHNLVLGRLFDGHVLDMIELGVNPESFMSLLDIKGEKMRLGSPPLMVFTGELWERLPELTKFRSMVIDMFSPRDIEKLSLKGIDHVISCTATEGGGATDADESMGETNSGSSSSGTSSSAPLIHFRVHKIELKKSGTKVPKVHLVPHGPNMDFTIRRRQFAASDLLKESMRVPHQQRVDGKRPKNVSVDEFGETLGRVHMEKQDFTKLEIKKGKALRVDKKTRRLQAESGDKEEDDDKDNGDIDIGERKRRRTLIEQAAKEAEEEEKE